MGQISTRGHGSPGSGTAASQAGNGRGIAPRRGCDGVLRRSLIVLAIALLTAGPAGAGTIIVKLTFAPGKLVAKSAAASATADGPVQVPVTVADGRGSGNGWTLRLATRRPVTVTSITARCAASSTCTLPRAAQGPTGRLVLHAAHDTGMGVMNLVVTVAPLPRRREARAGRLHGQLVGYRVRKLPRRERQSACSVAALVEPVSSPSST